MKKIKWREKAIKEEILEHRREMRTFLNNILRREANWIGYILRLSSLLHDAIEVTAVEEVG